MPTFNFADVIASSSANVVSLTTYLTPLLYIAFAVTICVAAFKFVLGIFGWLKNELSKLFAPHWHDDPLTGRSYSSIRDHENAERVRRGEKLFD